MIDIDLLDSRLGRAAPTQTVQQSFKGRATEQKWIGSKFLTADLILCEMIRLIPDMTKIWPPLPVSQSFNCKEFDMP